jgi:hypothetical protein
LLPSVRDTTKLPFGYRNAVVLNPVIQCLNREVPLVVIYPYDEARLIATVMFRLAAVTDGPSVSPGQRIVIRARYSRIEPGPKAITTSARGSLILGTIFPFFQGSESIVGRTKGCEDKTYK